MSAGFCRSPPSKKALHVAFHFAIFLVRSQCKVLYQQSVSHSQTTEVKQFVYQWECSDCVIDCNDRRPQSVDTDGNVCPNVVPTERFSWLSLTKGKLSLTINRRVNRGAFSVTLSGNLMSSFCLKLVDQKTFLRSLTDSFHCDELRLNGSNNKIRFVDGNFWLRLSDGVHSLVARKWLLKARQ